MSELLLTSVLTCPHCGFARPETMPTDACQFFFECTHCRTVLRPKAGDCCVFCSYGSVQCPPVQDSVVAWVSWRRHRPEDLFSLRGLESRG